MASAIPSLVFCLLLLAPHLGTATWYTTYTNGAQRVNGPSMTTSCSSIPSGRGDGAMPVMHRLSPCSPLGASLSQGQPTTGEVLHRDALRLSSLFGDDDSGAAAAPAAEPSTDVSVTIPSTVTPLQALPGASDYHVVVGYGTPEQKFSVGFDTAAGTSLVKCKPCAAGRPCNKPAFDPSLSSSLAPIPCRSPECPMTACTTPGCTFSMDLEILNATVVLLNGSFVTDTLTLSPSAAVEGFRFVCMEMTSPDDDSFSVLDLSRDAHSLASRPRPSPFTVAFSYCLPLNLGTEGFLSVGAPRPELSGHSVSYTPLRTSSAHPKLYVVRLAAISVGGEDIPVVPYELFGDSVIELHTTFTYLRLAVYDALRSAFHERMTKYRHRRAPPQGDLDTCYDFTGLEVIALPDITLKFDGGATLDLDLGEMMYFKDRGNFFSVGCLAFAPMPASSPNYVAVIGRLTQASTEVIYDVAAGKLGFLPHRC